MPVLAPAPAALLLAARLPTDRAAGGVLAAGVQQGVVSADALLDWIDRLRPLPRSDASWVTASGVTIALEVDGAFHRDADQWADDIARQRALTSPTYPIVRCTAQELRDHPERIAADLHALGVPRRTAPAA